MPERVPIAVAILVSNDQVLLAHRHPNRRWYPDCWDLIGGHVEPGESPDQSVIRECREELGVLVSDPQAVSMEFADPTLEMHAFLVTTWVGEPVNAAPDEHDDLRWFAPHELADLTMADPGARASILRAIESAAPG